MLVTIIDKITGQEYYATTKAGELSEHEIAIEAIRTDWMLKPFWDFDKKEFYETATQEEIDLYNEENAI